ncbi:type III secretion system inner membrane ring lipoprotein SctJ [Salinicola avicenniae]|uniref:type III secretion system inner membrane ring lipoprotein SctJ n=1 Tax=Salinicola avicenniae TaxID=2916836 RepID=UPI0020745EE2|nr:MULTISPECIES: type III secretion inner membrane ring lipoprotein SctJ [unclassified Salinicola]
MKTGLLLLAALMVMLLAGCDGQSQLYSGLSERNANDVLAELRRQQIPASRASGDEGIAVLIDPTDTQRAVEALNAAGLPRKTRTDLGEVFKKDGIISTPFAEKARYIYSLSQELESTLGQIDGVVSARVQVVLPDRVAPGEPVQPASASVFLKHNDRLDPDVMRARVRQLVAGSIPGMAGADGGDKLSVVFVPAQTYQAEQPQLAAFGPFLLPQERIGFWRNLAVGVGILLIGVAALGMWRLRHRANSVRQGQQVAAPRSDSRPDGSISDILGMPAGASNDTPPPPHDDEGSSSYRDAPP